MIRRPPRSTLFPLHDALPIYGIACETETQAVVTSTQPSGKLAYTGVDVEGLIRLGAILVSGGTLVLLAGVDRKSTRLNSSHANISYAVFCLKKKKKLIAD